MNIRSLPPVVCLLGILLVEGCGSSSPRFRDREAKPEEKTTERKGARFSSKEAEEESRENSKKVDPGEIEKIKSGARDFKKEKNPSIKPLDQSKMMREISKYMGVPYVLGGMSADGLDCSGYTTLVYKNAMGIQLARSASEQAKQGRPVKFEELKFGDLVFFNTTGQADSHVGIYLGDDLFAHASVTLGVTISSLQSFYYQKRYEEARRIVD